jgi:hypothetical protein
MQQTLVKREQILITIRGQRHAQLAGDQPAELAERILAAE